MAIRVYNCGHSRTVHSRKDNSRYKINGPCPRCSGKNGVFVRTTIIQKKKLLVLKKLS